MRLESLSLRHFRNYTRLHLELDGDLFLFLGANGQGKTNLLEAVGLVVTGRSPRASRYHDVIQWGEEEASVKARARRLDSPVEVEVRLRRRGPHTFLLQGKPVSRTSELLGQIWAVFFFPDDLQLVKGGPALRRRLLDMQLVQLKAAYRERLLAYQRVVRQRNALLADLRPGREALQRLLPWDEHMVRLGSYVMRERAAAVARLAPEARRAYRDVSGGAEELHVAYRPFWSDSEGEGGEPEELPADPEAWEERFRQELERHRGREIARRTTLVGPQRDDVDLLLDGRPARAFASQGQQRSIVLALKAAEVVHLHQETGEPPLLLLDDVFSELDEGRRRRLLQAAGPRAQVFITGTGIDPWPRPEGLVVRAFAIEGGTVRPMGEAGGGPFGAGRSGMV